MSSFTETLRTRVERDLREQFERMAEQRMISPSALLRIYLREGLERDRDRSEHSRRV